MQAWYRHEFQRDVYPEHNSKKNDPKVFKLGVGMSLGYPRSDTVLEFKGQRSRSQGLSSFRILEPCLLEPRFIDIHYVTFCLRFCRCLVRASLTLAIGGVTTNQSSAWVRNRDRVPSSCGCTQRPMKYKADLFAVHS